MGEFDCGRRRSAYMQGNHFGSAISRQPILSVQDLSKTYANGFQALKRVSLDVRKGADSGAARAERGGQDHA